MGNVSPRQSKSYHDGLNNHLSLSAATATTTTTTTPNRSSWKKQLQILNDTLNIKNFSLRHPHGRSKRYRTTFDENNHPKLSTSMTTQNFHDLIKNNCEKSTMKNERVFKKLSQENPERHNSFKKSLSLFSIKQPLADSTNKETLIKSIHHPPNTIKENDEEQPPSSLNSYTKKELSVTQENQIANGFHQHKRRQKFEITTGEYDNTSSLQLGSRVSSIYN
jgi:hypothetical protein